MTLIKEFRDFALKGNLVELAVAFVLGVAFAAVVTSLVDDIVMQLIAAIVGQPSFNDLSFVINDSEIRYGAFLTTLVGFLIVAFALFLIVKLVNRAMPPGEAKTRSCPHCLTAIPVAAPVCASCARDVEPV